MSPRRKSHAKKRSVEDRAVTFKFGQVVRKEREQAEISQEELGFRSGLDRTYIGGIERGERNPTITTIQKIAKGLGRPVGEMLRKLA
jgi:transcriptional regulator with XRE-family HTH domain